MEILSWYPLLLLIPALGLLIYAWKVSLVDRPQSLKWAAFACRVLSTVLLIFALCRPFHHQISHDTHIVFLVDVSESIDGDALQKSIGEVKQSIASLDQNDTHTIIAFARDSRILSIAELEALVTEIKAGRADADFRSATSLTRAISAARLYFPAEKSRRLVVMSDGAIDDKAQQIVAQLHREHTDVVFRRLPPITHAEACVTSLEAPSPVAYEGEIVRLKVHLAANQDIKAKLRITNRGVVVAEKIVAITAGKELIERVDVEMTTSGETVWEAEIAPENDWFPINNRAATGISVRGKPRILCIHTRPQAMRAAERLMREQGIEMETRGARGLPEEIRDMLAYDAIVLADVPATSLNARQMTRLKSYVSDFGGGLIMMGSENTYGLGGYYKTPVEEVLPLVSRFEKEKEKPSLAMIIVLDRSGSMSGTPLALARQAARSAAELLSPQDQICVIAFDDQATLVLDLTPAGNRAQIAAAIDSIAEGGGTNMQPAMVQARDILRGASAKVKHVIGLTDGQTDSSNLVQLCQEMADSGTTVSTVAMGDGAARELLAQMAQAGNGRYYETTAPENVPQIFTRETMQASRSAIKEDIYSVAAVSDHPALTGFTDATFPPVLGYVMAKPKPTAQVLLSLESGDPYLAIGRYGSGTGVCCTADLTERWSSEWLTWGGCGKFWAQIFRSALKRADATGVEVHPQITQDSLQLSIRRTDEAGRPLARIPWQLHALDDKNAERPSNIQEIGIGRYTAETSLKETKSLTLRLHDTEYGKVKLVQWLRPYPAEYQLSSTCDPTLLALATYEPDQVKKGLELINTRRTLIPPLCLAAIVLLIAGLILRRV